MAALDGISFGKSIAGNIDSAIPGTSSLRTALIDAINQLGGLEGLRAAGIYDPSKGNGVFGRTELERLVAAGGISPRTKTQLTQAFSTIFPSYASQGGAAGGATKKPAEQAPTLGFGAKLAGATTAEEQAAINAYISGLATSGNLPFNIYGGDKGIIGLQDLKRLLDAGVSDPAMRDLFTRLTGGGGPGGGGRPGDGPGPGGGGPGPGGGPGGGGGGANPQDPDLSRFLDLYNRMLIPADASKPVLPTPAEQLPYIPMAGRAQPFVGWNPVTPNDPMLQAPPQALPNLSFMSPPPLDAGILNNYLFPPVIPKLTDTSGGPGDGPGGAGDGTGDQPPGGSGGGDNRPRR